MHRAVSVVLAVAATAFLAACGGGAGGVARAQYAQERACPAGDVKVTKVKDEPVPEGQESKYAGKKIELFRASGCNAQQLYACAQTPVEGGSAQMQCTAR